ncbi:hypothetical protein KEM56_007600 [Ascosphaera pollenicola]|nr:hypothetical protein KEM56_007600 [Ascosphaera pollenicola]
MGWFWTSNTTAGNDDPTKHLDSGLKDYLKKESPAAYQLPQVAETDSSSGLSSSQPKTDPASASASPNSPSDEASTKGVPSESLFQDGRYAHLWKTYQPLEVVEKQGATSSGAEKVIEQFKKRKARLNETALENCAEEHEALSLCFKRGGVGSKVWARVTLCRDENAKFSRCYTMQAKFLQALGYASSLRSDSETEERIQMHADKLYHQMLDYERRVEEAKAAGGPIPPPESLFHPDASPSPSTPSESPSTEKYEVPGGETLPPGMRFSKPASKLTPHERELEIRVARQQLEQRDLYKTEVNDLLVEEEEAKRLRQKKMSSWFGETVGKWLS